MDYYKPSQNDIYFVYDHIANSVSIKSHVSVRLPAGESLTVTRIYTDATKTAKKEFDHAQNPSQLLPYEFVDDSAVEFISHVDIPYDPQDQEAFKIALRNTFADEYTIIAIVLEKQGQPGTGGQATKTFKKTESIEIV